MYEVGDGGIFGENDGVFVLDVVFESLWGELLYKCICSWVFGVCRCVDGVENVVYVVEVVVWVVFWCFV